MAPISFTINHAGDAPQGKFTKWYATPDTGEKGFLVGYATHFSDGDGAHTGLNTVKYLAELPRLYYDRNGAAQDSAVGLWAHFMWPTIAAESSDGHHLLVNTYDRARFTFGFYQLAAHTPGDNLILLFRKLLTLPRAADYFPDLMLKDGKVHRQVNDTVASLEVVTSVKRPNNKTEDQILGFMQYLNPDTSTIGNIEVENAARLQHWLVHDPAAIAASVEVAMGIARRKLHALAKKHDLVGKDVRLAIWASDITHQGRGKSADIAAALARTGLDQQLEALYLVGSSNPDYDGRRKKVRAEIAKLTDEAVFKGVTLGDASLPV